MAIEKVTIIGVGAVGSLFGSRLVGMADLWLLGNWKEQLQAIKEDGLRVVSREGEKTVRLRATSDPGEIGGGADLVLIAVKSYQTERVAEAARRLVADDGVVLTLQNGLGNYEILARYAGEERTAQGVTSHGATMVGPGVVKHSGEGDTHIAVNKAMDWINPNLHDRLKEVALLFNDANIRTTLEMDLKSMQWGKLVINAAINPLTAILRVPNGRLAELEGAIYIMREAANEGANVARASGIALPYDDPLRRVLQVARATAENCSSMLYDVARGAPTEIDFINGAIVREGERTGIPTPANRYLLWTLKSIEGAAEECRPRTDGAESMPG